MNNAIQFILAIASNMTEQNIELKSIIDVLEDGEALGYMGASNEDILLVEDAHALVSEWMNDGKKLLGQCRF